MLQNFVRVLAVCCVISSVVRAENWPAWRGPAGNSVSTETNLPRQWSENANNVRKTPLPAWGDSTPAIWENAVFLTSENDGRLLLLRIDKSTGKIVWTREVGRGTAPRKGEGKRSSKFHNLHNLASPSPVTDGERVIVHFGNGLLESYTFKGEREWSRDLVKDFGAYTIWWGHANSPVLFRDLVISVCMQDPLDGEQDKLALSYLVAHDKRTGKQVWLTQRMTGAHAEEGDAYTTPVFYDSPDGKRMIVMGGNQLDAYDPATGKLIWKLPGLVGGRTITGPTLSEDMVFATVGMRGPLHAVSLNAQGERDPKDAVKWKQTQSTPDSCCPVISNGLLFLVTDNGIASCFDAKTGELQVAGTLVGPKLQSLALGGGWADLFSQPRWPLHCRGGRCQISSSRREQTRR